MLRTCAEKCSKPKIFLAVIKNKIVIKNLLNIRLSMHALKLSPYSQQYKQKLLNFRHHFLFIFALFF